MSGEHKVRPLPPGMDITAAPRGISANLSGGRLCATDIDIVMCTHLHADHVGWNTRLESGRSVPTFSERALYHEQTEIDAHAEEAGVRLQADHGNFQRQRFADSMPALHAMVEPGDEIADGALIVAYAGPRSGQPG